MPSPSRSPADGTTAGRRWMVYALFAAIAGGSAYDALVFREHWPFSHYPMYATVQGPHFQRLRLFGVTADGEIPLDASQHLAPFDDPRLSTVLLRMAAHPRRRELLTIAAGWLLERYGDLAAQGEHDGPPLRGLRLYRLVWELDPTLSNLEAPDRRQLLLAMEPRPPAESDGGAP